MKDEMNVTIGDKSTSQPELIGVDLGSGPDVTVTQDLPVSQGENSDKPSAEGRVAISDPDNPFNDVSEKQLRQLMDNVKESVQVMESLWRSTQKEFDITTSHVNQLYKFNNDHLTPLPDITVGPGEVMYEERSYDPLNGLDHLTEEDVVSIFGADSKIIGVTHSQTLDRVKEVLGDYIAWSSAMGEYKEVIDAYNQLIELEEEKNIQILKARADAETDPEKKEKMQQALDTYYKRKYLGFLVDEVDDEMKKRIAAAWKDSQKIQYWMNRARDKLSRLRISTKCILEMSQFEKRYLDEKYHRISNILLVYFLCLVTYCSVDNKQDANRNKAVCMVLSLDGIIRKSVSEEVREKVLNNVIAFEEQMLQVIPDTTQGSQNTSSEE